MKKSKLSRLNKILEVPSEITSQIPKLTNLGFKKMMIENYKNILEYQDFFIRINTSIGIININGFGMKMEEMTKDDIIIEGDIDFGLVPGDDCFVFVGLLDNLPHNRVPLLG